MTSDIRVVLDTNVTVSAALFEQSTPRRAFNFVLEHETSLISSATIAELNDVLLRPHFDAYMTEESRMQFLAALVWGSELVDVTVELSVCRDPTDNKFLELAVSGEATHIISGGEDLVVLHPFRGVEILTPMDFVRQQELRI